MTTYSSVQRPPSWVAVLIVSTFLVSLLTILGTSYEAMGQYLSGSGELYDAGQESFWALIGVSTLEIGLYFLFLRSPLHVRINPEGIHYKLFPFVISQKLIPWNDMESVSFTIVHPLTDFGGWGYRRTFSGKRGYIMKEGPAIEVHFKERKYVLVFTINDAEKAKSVVEKFATTATS
ncbi:MAG: hypothetical protein HWE14_02645 [Flavobacteriia bacterium]|nr:hypothetical protein [Flavobacteriia bacterium]